jgi:hypothetical protein
MVCFRGFLALLKTMHDKMKAGKNVDAEIVDLMFLLWAIEEEATIEGADSKMNSSARILLA